MVIPALPVTIQTMLMKQQGTTIYYPQVIGLQDLSVQNTINQSIFRLVNFLVRQQYEQQGTDTFTEMISTFEIKTNERNVLSLTLTNYAIAYHYAHGLTITKSLTLDTQTGKNYQLHDLFKQDSNYIGVLSNLVKNQIEERGLPILDHFPGVSSNQDFYIADKVLVLYFQAYEISPGYVGLPMFPIPVYQLQDIIRENGPLERMMA